MFIRVAVFVLALIAMAAPVEARRIALVIGQNAYPGGASATIGLPHLDNPVGDANRLVEILAEHDFEVISCDGKAPGCFDLDRRHFLDALKRLEQRAVSADLALVFFAGHGLASEEGNVLTPVDARVNCATGAVTQAYFPHVDEPISRQFLATAAAEMRPLTRQAARAPGAGAR